MGATMHRQGPFQLLCEGRAGRAHSHEQVGAVTRCSSMRKVVAMQPPQTRHSDPQPEAPATATDAPNHDDEIRRLVTRLSRPNAKGGRVIERAAILAEGAHSEAIFAWLAAEAWEPEVAKVKAAGGFGLHSARGREEDQAGTRVPLRYVQRPTT